MTHAFQMEHAVDKKKEEMRGGGMAVARRFAPRYFGAQNDLAGALADLIRKHVRGVRLLAEYAIQELRFRWLYERD